MPRVKKATTKKIIEKKAKIKKVAKPRKIKKKVEKIKKVIEVKPPLTKTEKYYEAIGRRKTAVARIRLFTRGEKIFLVNKKSLEHYFPTLESQEIAKAALQVMNCLDKFRVLAVVKGGGYHSQAEALQHGIARALVLFNPDFRKRLKRVGYLKRDSRMRERKKFGLKRARRAAQWSKR